MKTLKYTAILLAFAVMAACSSSKSEEASSTEINGVKVTRTVVANADQAKCTAKIALDGMSCAMACGGSIKNCLKGIDGVKQADIFFDPERKAQDIATVEFDNKVVTEKEMIAAIEKLNDGQYKVKSVEIVVSEVSYEKINKEEPKKEEEPVKTSTGKVVALQQITIALPTVFDVLTRIIR